MTGYSWQRTPNYKIDYDILEQPLSFTFRPKEDSNDDIDNMKVKFFTDANNDKEGAFRVNATHTAFQLTNCNPKLIETLQTDSWFTMEHSWTLTLTNDFFIAALENVPFYRWDFDDSNGCRENWDRTDLKRIRLKQMTEEHDYESWFYSSWTPTDSVAWENVVADRSESLEETSLLINNLQLTVSEGGGTISVFLTDSAGGNQAQFQIFTTTNKYWLWGCSENNAPEDFQGTCDSRLWEIDVNADVFSISCNGETFVSYEYTGSSSTTCLSMWKDAAFDSFKFTSDTTSEQYRLVPEETPIDETGKNTLNSRGYVDY